MSFQEYCKIRDMQTHKLPKELVTVLLEEARHGQKNAHAIYSGHQIGASVLTKSGMVFSGGNVENSSYGGTVCAERVALWKAVTEGAKPPFDVVCVISSTTDIWPPCGLCRQVMTEFCHKDTIILASNKSGKTKSFLFKDLLPEAFDPSFLKKKPSKK